MDRQSLGVYSGIWNGLINHKLSKRSNAVRTWHQNLSEFNFNRICKWRGFHTKVNYNLRVGAHASQGRKTIPRRRGLCSPF